MSTDWNAGYGGQGEITRLEREIEYRRHDHLEACRLVDEMRKQRDRATELLERLSRDVMLRADILAEIRDFLSSLKGGA